MYTSSIFNQSERRSKDYDAPLSERNTILYHFFLTVNSMLPYINVVNSSVLIDEGIFKNILSSFCSFFAFEISP